MLKKILYFLLFTLNSILIALGYFIVVEFPIYINTGRSYAFGILGLSMFLLTGIAHTYYWSKYVPKR